MCALTAGQRGKRVLLLEHLNQAGAKILISGGGRCNFTNREVGPEHFHSANPHFCKSALSRFNQHDFITIVERHRIAYHEKTLGQLFCDGSAREIVAMLLDECRAAQVTIGLGYHISEIINATGFKVVTDRGGFQAPALVIATGGLSIPKMGATSFAYDLARRFQIGIVETRPGLVPLRFGDEMLSFCRALSGVSVEATVSCRNAQFHEAVLFTHRGLSGPAILQVSSLWRAGDIISIDLLPGLDAPAFLIKRKRLRPKAELKTVLGEVLPNRLAQRLAADYPGQIRDLPDRVLLAFAKNLQSWKLVPDGSEGWAKAEVTVGGISTAELSSRTMEVCRVPGMYFIGEAVDVTGWLGGYNFQWAWSSGWCAGQAI